MAKCPADSVCRNNADGTTDNMTCQVINLASVGAACNLEYALCNINLVCDTAKNAGVTAPMTGICSLKAEANCSDNISDCVSTATCEESGTPDIKFCKTKVESGGICKGTMGAETATAEGT